MIYLCIPAHNEGQTIGVVLWKIRQVLAEAERDYQILVADDGSTDQTAEVLEPYTRVLPLTVMRSAQRRGYGASLEMLLREAVHRSEYPRRDAIVVLQGDFTEEPAHIPTLLKRIESGADVVVSNPAPERGGGLRAGLRRFAMRTLLRRSGLPPAARQPLVGYHAYRVASVRRALEERGSQRLLRWEGPAANAALLRAVVPHARRVDAVDLTLHPERRQRASRADSAAQLREVWAFSRNREASGLIPVVGLAPSETRSARSKDHVVSIESLRRAGVSLSGEEDTGRRRPGRSRNGNAGRGVKDRRSSRSDRTAPKSGSGETATKRRRRREPVPETPEAAAPPESPRPADGPAGEDGVPKRRRTRRGGRKRTRPGPDNDVQATESVPEVAEAGGEPGGSSEGQADVEPGEGGARPRRRRGRRGGRRRSSRPTTDGVTGEAGGGDVGTPDPEQS